MLSYAVYVACTIHVHNAVAVAGTGRSLSSDGESAGTGTSPGNTASVLPSDPSLLLRASLVCLDELAVPNSGVADTARIIRKLMAAKSISEHAGPMGAGTGAGAFERRSGPQFDAQYMLTRSTHDTSADNGTLSAALTMPLSFDTSWQLFNDPSPGIEFEPSTQSQSFSDFGLTANGGHDLLFGFMDGSFSPNGFMGGT